MNADMKRFKDCPACERFCGGDSGGGGGYDDNNSDNNSSYHLPSTHCVPDTAQALQSTQFLPTTP